MKRGLIILKNWQVSVVLSLVFFVTAQAESPLSLKGITEILQTSKNSRGEAINNLPDFLKAMQAKNGGRFKNFTLMKASDSAQGADCLNPRAIISSDDGKFVMSFTRNPKGENKLEMIQFDEKLKKFMPYELEFPTAKTSELLGKNTAPDFKGSRCCSEKMPQLPRR